MNPRHYFIQYSTWAIVILNITKMQADYSTLRDLSNLTTKLTIWSLLPLKKDEWAMPILNPLVVKIAKFLISLIVWKILGFFSDFSNYSWCQVFEILTSNVQYCINPKGFLKGQWSHSKSQSPKSLPPPFPFH